MIVDCAVYRDGYRTPEPVALVEAFEAAQRADGFVWIGLHEPTDDEFAAVRAEFDLHDLAVEDAIKAHQRPKLERFGDSVFVVLRSATYDDATETVALGEIMLFVGARFVVTVRHGAAPPLAPVRADLEAQRELLRCGPGAVVYAVLDRVVDGYAPVLAGLEDDIEEVEQEVFSDQSDAPTERIYKLKREVLDFHRATAPLVDPLDQLAHGRVPLIHPDLRHYFRDVGDHVRRVAEQVDGFRELLTSILEANLAQVGVRQNEDMRKISAWIAIAAVPTLLAGIYGMNVASLPGADSPWGFPAVVGVMVVIGVGLYRTFRRSGWL